MSYRYVSVLPVLGTNVKGDVCRSELAARKSFADALHVEAFGWGFPMHFDDRMGDYADEESFLAFCERGGAVSGFRPSAQELWSSLKSAVTSMSLVQSETS